MTKVITSMESTTPLIMETRPSSNISQLLEDQPHSLARVLSDFKLKSMSESFTKDWEQQMTGEEKRVILKYFLDWFATEKAMRKSALIESRIHSARFVKIQTVEMFNFKHSSLTEKVEKPYLALHQSLSRENLPCAIFSGTAGTGKTHLARALGYAACQKGLRVLFVTAAEMVNHLIHAQKDFHLERELNKYRRPDVLIIDELGYVSLDTPASNLFFQVISARHDASLGTIATTNLTFGKFNQIFANDAIAHAIVDRLVNEAEVFFMEGPSYREHQRQEKTKKRNQSE